MLMHVCVCKASGLISLVDQGCLTWKLIDDGCSTIRPDWRMVRSHVAGAGGVTDWRRCDADEMNPIRIGMIYLNLASLFVYSTMLSTISLVINWYVSMMLLALVRANAVTPGTWRITSCSRRWPTLGGSWTQVNLSLPHSSWLTVSPAAVSELLAFPRRSRPLTLNVKKYSNHCAIVWKLSKHSTLL